MSVFEETRVDPVFDVVQVFHRHPFERVDEEHAVFRPVRPQHQTVHFVVPMHLRTSKTHSGPDRSETIRTTLPTRYHDVIMSRRGGGRGAYVTRAVRLGRWRQFRFERFSGS